MRNRQQAGAVIAASALLALCAASASGCIRQTETPIVAEKPSPEASSKSPENSDSRNDSVPESSEQANVRQNSGQKNSDSAVWKLINVPSRYQADIAEEHLRLEADAPIEVPIVSQIPIIEIENSPYTEEDCTSVLSLMEKETGVLEWTQNEVFITDSGLELPPNTWVAYADKENPGNSEYFLIEEQNSTKSYTSSDGQYNFSFGQGSTPNSAPIMWLSSLSYSDSGNGQRDATDLSDFTTTGTALEALETTLKNKAESLIKRLSLSEFQLKTAEWRKIYATDNGNEFTGKYGLRLTYVKSFKGIPSVNRDTGWACAPMAPCQYIELLYLEDGTLLRMKNINREQVSANLGSEDFLLPFDAIAQIFEQYMKYYQTIYSFTDWSGYSGMTAAPSAALDQNPNLSIDVTSVRFGYQLIYDSWDSETLNKGTGKGHLIPVWAFYGTPKAGYWQNDGSSAGLLIPQANENGLLLTVNAVDGTVYGKE